MMVLKNKFIQITKKYDVVITFVLIIIFHAIISYFWWKTNTPIIPRQISSYCLQGALNGEFLFFYAPLCAWIMKGMFYVFGTKFYDLQIIIINYLFFIMGLLFIYKLGSELKNKLTGKIAMILLFITPSFYLESRYYGHQDWHIITPMIINIYCLIKTKQFTDFKWSIIYGISIGIGLLIKDTFLAYFCMPYVFIIFYSLISKFDFIKIKNILFATIIGCVLSCIHYFRKDIIIKVLSDNIQQAVPINFETTRCLTTGLWEQLLSPPIFILFVIGLIYFLFKYKQKDNKFIILIWILFPYLSIFFMKHYKSFEYCLGFVPALILIVSIFISDINKNIIRRVLLILIFIIGVFQFLYFSFVSPKFLPYKNICYYNLDSNKTMEAKEGIKNLIGFLKKSYPNSTIGVSETLEDEIADDEIILQFLLYDIKYTTIAIFSYDILYRDSNNFLSDVLNNDIIIFNYTSKKNLIDRCIAEYSSFTWKKAIFCKNENLILDRINKFMDFLYEHYYKVYEIETNGYYNNVIILKRKN